MIFEIFLLLYMNRIGLPDMKNLKILCVFSTVLPFFGCVTANSIKPNDVKQYNSPQSLIDGKKLNGKDGVGKEYLFEDSVQDALIPHAYMKNLCDAQGGKLFQMSKTSLGYMTGKHISALNDPNLLLATGTFHCASNTPWNVSIEPIASRIGGVTGSDPLNFITLKTSVVSKEQADSALRTSYQQERVIETKAKQAKEKAKSDQLRLKAEYERNLIVNAPKENDIGQTICKNTPLSAYTGTLVYGQPTYNQVEGIVIASLEGFSNDKQNIKINIKGWLNNSNQVSSGRDVLYKQTPLESGRVIWDNKQQWFKCNY